MWRRTCLQRYTWNFADGSCQLWRRETLLESMLADFPTLRLEDIQAAISFAATTAAEDVPALVHTGGYSSIAIRIELEENLPLSQASALPRKLAGFSLCARDLVGC